MEGYFFHILRYCEVATWVNNLGSDIICPKEVLLFSIILSTKDLCKYCFSPSFYQLMTYRSTAILCYITTKCLQILLLHVGISTQNGGCNTLCLVT